jgi:hypothetical protein
LLFSLLPGLQLLAEPGALQLFVLWLLPIEPTVMRFAPSSATPLTG